MATLQSKNYQTLTDLLNHVDPKGNAATIAEVLNENNPFLQDMPWEEANDTFAYTFTRRISLPEGQWRDFNEGVDVQASHTSKATEHIGMLESYSEADYALVKNHPSPEKYRMSEARAHIEGMSQTLARAFLYGNSGQEATPKVITGIAPRLSSLSSPNVFNNGGTGSNLTSLYIVQWGTDKVFGFHPKSHSSKGIEHEDLGKVTAERDGKKLEVYRDHFLIHCGLGVKDERCIARIANIDLSAKKGQKGYFDEDILIEAIDSMPNDAAGAVI